MNIESYRDYLNRLPISNHTRRNYLLRVRQYLHWLELTPDGNKALTDPVERNFAVQEYKLWLLNKGMSANTLNSALSALDNFYIFTGLGQAKVRRQSLPSVAPRALEPSEVDCSKKSLSANRSATRRSF